MSLPRPTDTGPALPGSPAHAGEFFEAAFHRSPVMAIVRGLAPDVTVALCQQAWSLGVALVEVPIQDHAAVDSLRAVIDAAHDAGHPVGAGTVLTAEQVTIAASCGAAFTVSPGWDAEVSAAARAAGLPHLPGVATASEVGQATARGHRWLKAFPANVLGPAWFSAIAEPFPAARFVAVGGVDSGNAARLRANGAHAVGAAGALRREGELARLVAAMGEAPV